MGEGKEEKGESKYRYDESDDEEGDLVDEVFTYEGLFNTKKSRLQSVSPDELPESYCSNSRKEELCLEYVDNFVRQFEALFPERKKLFVTPKNECGVPKFVCTTIRPTQLPFKQLYNVATAADFFSHFLQYEPLENPEAPPTFLPSPAFTLECQTGDCFDISTLLCSYLIGCGYDAYCVNGYAPRDITLLNRTQEDCSLSKRTQVIDLSQEEEFDEIILEDLRKTRAGKNIGDGSQEEEINWSEVLALPQAVEGNQTQGESSEEGKQMEQEGEEGIENMQSSQDGAELQESGLGDESKVGEATGEVPLGDGGDLSEAKLQTGEEESQVQEPQGTTLEANSGGEEDIAQAVEGEAVGGEESLAQSIEGKENAPEDRQQDEEEDPYAVDFGGVRQSLYQKEMLERRIGSDEGKEDPDSDDERDEPQPDELEGRRVHCWILVRAGKRGVDQSFFVEPSTGKLYDIYGSPYLGVEAVWNNKNYWVNMQQQSEDPMQISYNLDIEDDWEFIFVDDFHKSKEQSEMNHDESHLEPSLAEDPNVTLETETENDEEEKKSKEMILDLPPSWVEKLILTRDAYRRKYNTSGQRTQLFWKSKLESYAEHLHPHGLVKRLVLFKDKARTLPVQVREYFANRRDKLSLRVRFPLDGRVIEHFAEGRASGLKSIDEETGKTRTFVFYPGARLDGLLKRHEDMNERIVETFESRDDQLETRTIKLQPLSSEEGGASMNGRSKGYSRSEEKKADSISKLTMTLPRANFGGDLKIIKMKQIFSRNSSQDADQDISKRTFQLNTGTISVIYHYAKGRITRSTRVFHKDTSIPPEITMSGAFDRPLRPSEIEEEFQLHLQAEKDCYQSIRDAEREVQDIMSLRKREEANIVLEKSIFDTASEKAKQNTTKQADNQVEEEKDPRYVDYLTPFLQHIPNLKKIKRDEAEAARDACLKSLKERLLERANIIQCRLDEENAQLAKKQAAFQRSRDHVDGADQEFERFCSEAMFRIQILEQRLARHEESALSIYANLDQKLRNDPRLAILYDNASK